jgi:hypothetical protein
MTDLTQTWSGLPAPPDWHIVEGIYSYHEEGHPRCGHKWERLIGKQMSVLEDVSVKADGKRWLHVSVGNRKDNMPTWEDLLVVRKLFIGKHRECYQVFPTEDRYVRAHNVLHLWCCLDSPDGVLPHFEVKLHNTFCL